MTFEEWEREQQYLRDERQAIVHADIRPEDCWLSKQHVADPRERYGWRSLPGARHVTIAGSRRDGKAE